MMPGRAMWSALGCLAIPIAVAWIASPASSRPAAQLSPEIAARIAHGNARVLFAASC
jgi:hypothetical protein